MPAEVIVIVGGQWGDEGKGKVVDYLAGDAAMVIRANGGDNAGHTVVNNQGEFALHLVPSGIFNSDTINIIEAGVALNPKSLLVEMTDFESRGVDTKNLFISPEAQLTFDYHLVLDGLYEEDRGDGKIGTTGRGIGPTYADKVRRIGIRAGELRDPDEVLKHLRWNLDIHRMEHPKIRGTDEFATDYYEDFILAASRLLKDRIVDTHQLIHTELERDSRILIEGAQGTLLDINRGTYPNVTSSGTTVGGLVEAAGIPLRYITKALGVFKAYQTRVGNGGMPTELKNGQGDAIREKGHEYGATTGRPRRVGYFDGVAARYSQEINGFTDIVITRLDTLAEMGRLELCHEYVLGGSRTGRFPTDDNVLSKCEPAYGSIVHGWDEFKEQPVRFEDLDFSTQFYCRGIISFMPGARLYGVGVGPRREDFILLP